MLLPVLCPHYSFQLDLIYKGHSPEIKEYIIDMALNGSGIRDTDNWGAYPRHLEAYKPQPSKRNTQKIERKHLTWRSWIKRLVRKTICFSRSIQMHDIVLDLFVHRYECGLQA